MYEQVLAQHYERRCGSRTFLNYNHGLQALKLLITTMVCVGDLCEGVAAHIIYFLS